jgi:DNA-binding LytR/AlgR family response regulator
MNELVNQFIQSWNKNLKAFLSISVGVFLFILFFQPFPIDRFEFNNRLIFVAGMAAIPFICMCISKIIFHGFFPKKEEIPDGLIFSDYLEYLSLFIINSVALTFYLKYVGLVKINFYMIFKIGAICLAPPLILKLYDSFNKLKEQNILLKKDNRKFMTQLENYREDFLNKTIEFHSDNQNENLVLPITDVILIRSADNYVEILFQEGKVLKRKLVRNTLRNIEIRLKQFSVFVRCHRTCIINRLFVEKLHWNYQKQYISIKDYSEQVPVSRQYLSKLRELFN